MWLFSRTNCHCLYSRFPQTPRIYISSRWVFLYLEHNIKKSQPSTHVTTKNVSKHYNKNMKQTKFFQCIADLLAMLVFFVAVDARSYSFLKEFYFEYQHYYVAAGTLISFKFQFLFELFPASYNNIYYFLYIRCTGIIFLSLQRYLIITAPTSRITHVD